MDTLRELLRWWEKKSPEEREEHLRKTAENFERDCEERARREDEEDEEAERLERENGGAR